MTIYFIMPKTECLGISGLPLRRRCDDIYDAIVVCFSYLIYSSALACGIINCFALDKHFQHDELAYALETR